MTAKMKERMKEIMKEIVRQQIGCFIPGQNGWFEHVDNCIATEICPNCGNDLYFDEGVLEKDFREVTFLSCSNCNWEDYEKGVAGSADRYGLV